jgi:hypothetical protein
MFKFIVHLLFLITLCNGRTSFFTHMTLAHLEWFKIYNILFWFYNVSKPFKNFLNHAFHAIPTISKSIYSSSSMSLCCKLSCNFEPKDKTNVLPKDMYKLLLFNKIEAKQIEWDIHQKKGKIICWIF